MTQLLSAGFARLIKNKLFWFGNLLFTGFFVMLLIHNYQNMTAYPDIYHYTGDSMMFAPFQIIGLFASCYTGMFLGTEYKDGTLRNKLVVGRSRTQVYLSNLIISFIASLITCAFCVLVNLSVGVALFGAPELTLSQMLVISGLGMLMLASFAGIFTLISMLIPSKSAGSVVNILLFLMFVAATSYVMNRLQASEFTSPGYTYSMNGELQPMDPVPNPFYLRGPARQFFEFFRDTLPTCQGAILMAHMVERPLVMVLSSLGLTACTTVSGVFHFRRKDLK